MSFGRKRQWIFMGALLLAAFAALFAYVRHAPRSAPAGQHPLTELSESGLAPLRDAFNEASGHTRIIAFMSPT